MVKAGGAVMAAALMLSPFAAPARAAAQDSPYVLANSSVFAVAAQDGHAYTVMVAWPEGAAPPAGWPVLYILDGADNFAVAALTARRLARAGARSGISPGVIVGVDSGDLPRRVFDYTPKAGGYGIPTGAPAHGMATGGADAFLALLSEQLGPEIARRFPIDSARQALMGHSFGGLLALHALFTGRGNFARYIAVSPSLWYGGDLLQREESRFIAAPDAPSLLLAVGEAEGGPDGGSGSGVEALAARMDARFFELSGQSHGTTMLAAMGPALRFAFGEDRE